MDTTHPSEGSSCWTDIVGPVTDHDEMERMLGLGHPYNVVEQETLYYYDGPIVFVGRVEGDGRPRLDVLVQDSSSGPEGERTYVMTRHQLVFDHVESLMATLYKGCAPTMESYALAEEIIRYKSTSTQIGHPRQSHHIETTWGMEPEDVPDDELPARHLEAQGLPTPSNEINRGKI